MRLPERRIAAIFAATLLALIGGCSSSMSIERTFEDPDYVDAAYDHILVLGIAGNYNSRSRFERALASALTSGNTVATEYYEIAGGDQEITREKILAAISDHGFDAVIVTELGSQQSEVSIKQPYSRTKVVRRDDRPADFFRYDYEILKNPSQINVAMEVVLLTDFFEASEAKLIWSAESTVFDKENVSYLIDDTVEMIATKLKRDGLIAR